MPTTTATRPRRPPTVARLQQVGHGYPADSWTPDLIRQAEQAADTGHLRWAAELCDALLGDDRVGACRDQLVAILGLPLAFEDGVGKARRKARRAIEAEEDWWDAFSDESLGELLWWGVHLGVAIGEITWTDKGDRVVPKLHVWHPRALRFDPLTATWWVRLGDGSEEAVVIGDGRWVVFTPKSESTPWQHGAWRAVSRWWRLKRYAMFDWGEACEQAKGLKVASSVDGSKDDRDQLVEDLVDMGGDAAIALPPGWTMQQLAMTASTKDLFDGLITATNTSTAIRYLGQNLTTEVTGGSFAAAGVHAAIASSVLRALASALAACLRAQVWAAWALFNFGAEEAASWPSWQVEAPADTAKDATTAQARVGTAITLAGQGVRIDWNALAAEIKLPLLAALPVEDSADSAAKDPEAALNGAQVASLLQIVQQAALGAIPRETALQLITAAFPLDAAKADAILGSVGQGFVPQVLPDGKPLAPTDPSAPPPVARHAHGLGGAPRPPFVERKIDRPIAGASARPAFDPANPMWVFRLDRGHDPSVCNNVCDDHDGTIRRGDDPWWQTHAPPLHWNCHCYIEQLDGEQDATPDGALPDASKIVDGFGKGALPLSPEDAARAQQLAAVATEQLALPPSAQGRPPRDGGTGEIYNPRLPAPARVVPQRSLEVGGWVSGPWPSPWAEWDRATPADRALAALLIGLLLWGAAATLDDLLREREVDVSPGARKILDTEDGRLRNAVVTENP